MNSPKLLFFAAIFSSFNAFSQPAELIKRAESNDPRAQFELGQLYANAVGIPKNSTEALKWFNKSAAANNADAIARIGLMYEFGEGVDTDKSRAIELYRNAVNLGGNRGMIAYANALIRGSGIKKNKEQGHTLLKTASSNNSASAKYVLGANYRSGELMGEIPWKDLVSEAASSGNEDALILILVDDVIKGKDQKQIEDSFIKLTKYKGKNLIIDTTIAYHYLNNSKPPAIQSAKEILEPLATGGDVPAATLMVQVSALTEDYPNMLRYMLDVNKESPGTYNVEEYSKEYKKILQQKERQEREQARQAAFINAATKAQTESRAAQNDMQRGGIKATRDSDICKIISNKNIENWVGYINTLSANSDGLGVLNVAIAQGITLKTWNNSLSDIGSKTLIPPESKLFQKASQMKVGQKVAFSGTFLAGNGRECVLETSLSLAGSLSAPDYIFKFSDITAIQ